MSDDPASFPITTRQHLAQPPLTTTSRTRGDLCRPVQHGHCDGRIWLLLRELARALKEQSRMLEKV